MPTGHQLLWKLMNELHQTVFHFTGMTSHPESICAKPTILQHCRWCWREKGFAAVGLKGQICGSQFLCGYVMENSSWERQLSSGSFFFFSFKEILFKLWNIATLKIQTTVFFSESVLLLIWKFPNWALSFLKSEGNLSVIYQTLSCKKHVKIP